MIGRMSRLRLLPISMVMMAVLLMVKSVAIVVAAVPAAPVAAGPAAAADVGAKQPESPGAIPQSKANSPLSLPLPLPTVGGSAADIPVSNAERALLLDLRARRKELDARDTALGLRENVLTATEKRIAARADELIVLQKKLEALETARRDRDEANWKELVKVYEGMKPKDAAAIFNDLDLAIALPVFDRMKAAKMAVVLAAMQPDRARQITTQLAQMRNKANAVAGVATTTTKNGT